jgi:serine phosphatase RsbU (regulator of sigma subunit)/methanogenic corrinoid protein MtbC1
MRSTASLRDDYVAALVEPDARRARGLIGRAIDAGTDPHDVYLDVLAPALYEIGRLWESNEIGVAAEHLASSTTESVMAEIAGRLRTGAPHRGAAVVACVGEELHRLGSRIVSDFLESDGWDVEHLGAMVPVEQIVEVAASRRAGVVALSVTMQARLPELRRAVAELRALEPPPLVAIGGQGLGTFEVDADLRTQDPRELVARAAELPVPRSPRRGGADGPAAVHRLQGAYEVYDSSPEEQQRLVEEVMTLNDDLVRARRELTRQHEELARVAETLQRSLLPDELPSVPGLTLAARYVPGTNDRVAGDWYDALVLEDGQVALAIGDVAGKGVKAAARMGEIRTAVRAYAIDERDPSIILSRVNRLVAEDQMATALLAVLDPATGAWRQASAGHLPPLVIDPDGRASFLSGGHGGPLMVYTPVAPAEVVMEPGTRVLLFTDGLVERRDEPLDFSLERLRKAAEEAPADLGLEELCDLLLRLAPAGEGRDDIALLACELSR